MHALDSLWPRYRTILSYTGSILSLAGLLMFAPLLVLPARPDELSCATGFVVPGSILTCLGLFLWRALRPRARAALTLQEGGVIVLLSWIIVCVFSAFPFIIIQGLNFTQALFEAVSGWTTTGLSVIDVTGSTHTILIWRSIMQLAGGAGLAIIMLASLAGPVGTGLYAAERSEQLVAHVYSSSRLVIGIYAGYALAGIAAYWLAGMALFDAVNHSFAAVSTGGFSTRVASIGHWNSSVVETITIILMILGNLNFLTAYLLLHGRFKAVYRSGEVRLMAILIPLCAFLLFFFICCAAYPTFVKSIRVAVFETVSALTTTGFTTTGYSNWGSFGLFLLSILMVIGGGTCSTAGGMKQYRVYLLAKALCWEIKRPFLPRSAVIENYIWQGERKDFITDYKIARIAVFAFLYISTLAVGSAIIAAHGCGLKESLFEFSSALGTVGLSVGITNAAAPPLILWTEIVGMFLGRLEFFVVFVGVAKIIKDTRDAVRGNS